jgi:uncharacterized repeat protein (TIGR01451 family)
MHSMQKSFVAALLAALSTAAVGACLTDSAQSDFQSGVANNVDVISSPGNVVLVKSFAVDQQNTTLGTSGTPVTTTSWVGQTFTPGLSGRLTRVDINLFCNFCSGTPPSIVVGVRATSGGLPTGSDLATATISTINTSGVPAFYTAIFASPATVTLGTQYALVVHPTTNPVSGTIGYTRSGGFSNGANVYAGGMLINGANSGVNWSAQAFTSGDPTTDSGFMTYIHGGYAPAGDLTSSLRDSNPPAGATPSWTTLSWTATTPADTALKFQVAASNASGGPFNFVGPDDTAGTFFTTSGASLSQFSGNRFLKYRAFLSTVSSTATPTLADVTACYATTSSADLTIENNDGQASTTAGTTITYTIAVTNTGPSSITGANVADSFPGSLSCLWSCNIAGTGQCTPQGWGNIADSINLGSGSIATYTAMCAVASGASGALGNTASVAAPSNVDDPAPANNSATDMDTVVVATNVVMGLDDGVEYVQSGDVVDYLIELSNANGPSDAVINVIDALPPQLSAGSWVCNASGAAVCHAGSGNTLTDGATVPAGGKVDYVFSATVSAADGTFGNGGSATLQAGSNVPSGAIAANDAGDVIVVFHDGFEAAAAVAPIAAASPGAAGTTLQLGIDAGLLAGLGPTPTTIATGRAADGTALFRVQLLRLKGAPALRLVPAGAAATPWRSVDLGPHRLDIAWKAASRAGAADGSVDAGPSSTQVHAVHGSTRALARLDAALSNGVPWLVAIAP